MKSSRWWLVIVVSALSCSNGWTDEVGSDVLAKTRPEMKKRIEALKTRVSRLPLPEPTADEVKSGRSFVNNGRLRSLYLPESWQVSNFPARPSSGSNPPPTNAQRLTQMQSAPDYPFKTRLFWIVSRTNDCQYCLGHQELKLRRVGMTDDQIASLDCQWTAFPEDEQAAIKLARTMTITPHLVRDSDIKSLQKHYRDSQIIDIVQTIAGYNSTNRWTTSTGIPQDKSFGDEETELDTPTSEEFRSKETTVAPFDHKRRPNWESRTESNSAMRACSQRRPIVELPSVETARRVLASETPGTTPPAWFQAMSEIPGMALRVWKLRQAVAREGKLAANLKAMIAWVCAREDRAWYAASHARTRLNALGIDDDALFAIGEDESRFTKKEQRVFAFARKLTSAPHTIVDEDIANLRELFSDHEVAEIIFLICDANSFDRFTETLRLPVEDVFATVSQLP